MTSFFGSQEGDFSLSVKGISALCKTPTLVEIAASSDKVANIARLEDGRALNSSPGRADYFEVIRGAFKV